MRSKAGHFSFFLRLLSFTFLIVCFVECTDSLDAENCNTVKPSVISTNGSSVRLSYDSLERLASLEPIDINKPFRFADVIVTQKTILQYDLRGNLILVDFGAGSFLKFTYINDKLVSKLTQNQLGSGYNTDGRGTITERFSVSGYSQSRCSRERFLYNEQGNVDTCHVYVQDINYPGCSRLWQTFQYNFDERPNPLLTTLGLITTSDAPYLLSKNNCKSSNRIYALRGNAPLGKTDYRLMYDSKGRLIFIEVGQTQLSFAYCR